MSAYELETILAAAMLTVGVLGALLRATVMDRRLVQAMSAPMTPSKIEKYAVPPRRGARSTLTAKSQRSAPPRSSRISSSTHTTARPATSPDPLGHNLSEMREEIRHTGTAATTSPRSAHGAR